MVVAPEVELVVGRVFDFKIQFELVGAVGSAIAWFGHQVVDFTGSRTNTVHGADTDVVGAIRELQVANEKTVGSGAVGRERPYNYRELVVLKRSEYRAVVGLDLKALVAGVVVLEVQLGVKLPVDAVDHLGGEVVEVAGSILCCQRIRQKQHR